MKRIIALIVSAGVLLMQPLELTVFARTEVAEPSVSVPWAEVKPAQPGNDTGTGETANETQEETESQAEASPVPGVTEGRLPAKGGEAQLRYQAANLSRAANGSAVSGLKPLLNFNAYPDWNEPDAMANALNPAAKEKLPKLLTKFPKRITQITQEIENDVFPTDEEFFGVWNAETGSFENEPMVQYDYVSAYGETLYNVKQAVVNAPLLEDGSIDYSRAKEELLKYHRNVVNLRGLQEPTINTSTTLMSDLLLQNFHVNSNWKLAAMFFMNQQEQEITVDVTEAVKRYRSGKGSLIVHAVHKDDYEAVFYSREAGKAHAPYIEVVINGSTTYTVPIDQDGYVTAGSMRDDTSGGTDTRMYAREAALDTAAAGILTDENTRRTYLLFNFGEYVPEGTITSASLHLYGGVEDRATAPRHDSSYQKLMMIADNGTAWIETDLKFSSELLRTYAYSFQSLPDSGMPTAFWGFPAPECNADGRQDQELLRVGTWRDIMGKQYYVTGNEDYAQACVLFLYDFIRQTFLIYSGEEGTMGRYDSVGTNQNDGRMLFGGYACTLDASARASGISKNFDYIINSEYMTPEIFVTFLKYFRTMGEHFVNDYWSSSENGGNWGTAQTNGHFAIMAYFPEIAEQKEWSEAISKHLMAATGNIVHADGSSHELSHSYTSYALGTQLGIKTTADELQMPFEYSDELTNRIRDVTVYMMRMALPGGYDPQYGDSGEYTRSYQDRFEYVGDWLEEPTLQWMAHEGKVGHKPEYTSYCYPEDGRMMAMRSGWDKKDLFLHITADAANGTHSHWDDGGIIVSAYGNYLLSDQGVISGYVGDDLPHRWMISSRGHNTVEINDYNQNSDTPNNSDSALNKGGGSKGDFKNVTFHDTYDYTKLDLTSLYTNLSYRKDPVMAPGGNGTIPPLEPGMKFERNILFIKPNFWIVSDYMKPVNQKKVNKYSQYWHMTPEANISIDGQYVLRDGEVIPWQHSSFDDVDKQIENTEYVAGTGSGAFKSNFSGEANIQVIPVGNIGNIGNNYTAETVGSEKTVTELNAEAEAAAAENGVIEPRLCYGYYQKNGSAPYGRYDKYAVGTTGFDTILFPTKSGDSYSIVPNALEVKGFNTDQHQGAATAFTANIKADSGSSAKEEYNINYFLLHETDKKDEGADLTFGSYATDGDIVYYEQAQNGIPRRAIIQNGTHIANSNWDYELLRSNKVLSDLTVVWNGSALTLEGAGDMADIENGASNKDAEPIDLTQVTIYAPYKISKVTYN